MTNFFRKASAVRRADFLNTHSSRANGVYVVVPRIAGFKSWRVVLQPRKRRFDGQVGRH